jgi:hypothetical protein
MPKRLNSLWTFLDIFRFMPINVKPQRAQCVRVEYKSSLAPPQWQTLGDATADANGYVTGSDPLAENPPIRFYRAALP